MKLMLSPNNMPSMPHSVSVVFTTNSELFILKYMYVYYNDYRDTIKIPQLSDEIITCTYIIIIIKLTEYFRSIKAAMGAFLID